MPRLGWPRHFKTRRKETMPLHPRSFCNDEGATLVESALALTVLFALLFGIFDFSMGFFTYHYIAEAAREGARWAMVRGADSCTNTPSLTDCDASESDISDYVKSLGYPGIDSRNMTVKVNTWKYDSSTSSWTDCGEMKDGTVCNTPEKIGNVIGNKVQVKVTYDFPLSIPFWGTETVPVYSTSSVVFSQ